MKAKKTLRSFSLVLASGMVLASNGAASEIFPSGDSYHLFSCLHVNSPFDGTPVLENENTEFLLALTEDFAAARLVKRPYRSDAGETAPLDGTETLLCETSEVETPSLPGMISLDGPSPDRKAIRAACEGRQIQANYPGFPTNTLVGEPYGYLIMVDPVLIGSEAAGEFAHGTLSCRYDVIP